MKKLCLICVLLISSQAAAQQKNAQIARVRKIVKRLTPRLTEIRRHLHQYPELSYQEFKTAAFVAKELKKLGFEVREKVADTGVVAVLRGKKPGKIAAVRADMDALPIQERNNLPFKSKNQGIMHACGHDIHTTVGLGTAMVLAELKGEFEGTVKFLFQPAEETAPPGKLTGSAEMIEQGALENPRPEIIFGLHVSPGIEAGLLGYTPGGTQASVDNFYITVRGEGTHAASYWKGIDPVVCAAQLVTAIQNIRSRMTDTRDPLVVSVSTIHGGNRPNIIPEEVELSGTIRTHSTKLRKRAPELLEQVVAGMCQAHRTKCQVRIKQGSPMVFNNLDVCDWAVAVLKKVLGDDKVNRSRPSMGAEDFALYAERLPSLYYRLGVGNRKKGWTKPAHSPEFIADERSIPVGVEAMSNLVLSYLTSDVSFKQ